MRFGHAKPSICGSAPGFTESEDGFGTCFHSRLRIEVEATAEAATKNQLHAAPAIAILLTGIILYSVYCTVLRSRNII